MSLDANTDSPSLSSSSLKHGGSRQKELLSADSTLSSKKSRELGYADGALWNSGKTSKQFSIFTDDDAMSLPRKHYTQQRSGGLARVMSPRHQESKISVYADGTSEEESDDSNKENTAPEDDISEPVVLTELKRSRSFSKVFADVAENDPRRRLEARSGDAARRRVKRPASSSSYDAETTSLMNSLHPEGSADSEYASEEEMLPGYVTPPRPHIRRFAPEDCVGPLLQSRAQEQWPLSAPARAVRLFDLGGMDGVRRRLTFEVLHDKEVATSK